MISGNDRRRLIDTIFRRADAWAERLLASVLILVWTMTALWMFGVIGGDVGVKGPILRSSISSSANVQKVVNNIFGGNDFLSDDKKTIDKKYFQKLPAADRKTLQGVYCKYISDYGTELSEIRYYSKTYPGFCDVATTILIRAPLSGLAVPPTVTAFVSALLLAVLGWCFLQMVQYIRGVRLAYRRLYVSEHEAEHMRSRAG
jgi:hypothetical protein